MARLIQAWDSKKSFAPGRLDDGGPVRTFLRPKGKPTKDAMTGWRTETPDRRPRDGSPTTDGYAERDAALSL